MAVLAHLGDDFGQTDGIRDAPVGRSADHDTFAADLANDVASTTGVEFGNRINSESAPAVGAAEGDFDGVLGIVIEIDFALVDADRLNHGNHTFNTGHFFEMRDVDDDQHILAGGNFELAAKGVFLIVGDTVETDFAHCDTARMVEIGLDVGQHLVHQRTVAGLFGVVGDGTIVVDAEAFGPLGFKLEVELKVVEKCTGIAPRTTQPEGRLDTGPDTGFVHRLVVVRRARIHVNMGFDKSHDAAPLYCRLE